MRAPIRPLTPQEITFKAGMIRGALASDPDALLAFDKLLNDMAHVLTRESRLNVDYAKVLLDSTKGA